MAVSSSTVTVEPEVGFHVDLAEFSGPFDVLLGLISEKSLELTELALHQVTDEFCAYIRDLGSDWDLDEASGFVVVAATLLDLKAARLLPSGEVENEDDLALLEARDLLFARLLQYRAFKDVSARFEEILADYIGVLPREVGLDPEFRQLQPDVELRVSPAQFAELAAAALTPRLPTPVDLDHLHVPAYSVAEQAEVLADRLRSLGAATFRTLVSDARDTGLVVVRFLALLSLTSQGAVTLTQESALGELHVRWTGVDFDPERLVEILAEDEAT